MEGIQDKDYNFLGNDKFPNLNERLLHERKLKSGYLERRIYKRPLKSEPSIENQSEHTELKLTLHQSLVKRKFITKRHRRAREPSRISLRFLRHLKNKSSMLRRLSSKGFRRFLYRSPQSCIAMSKRLESFIIHVINVIINTIQRYFI